MTTTESIRTFASTHAGPFKRKELLETLGVKGDKKAEQAFSLQLNRLVSSGKLERVGYGSYRLPDGGKEYVYRLTEEERKIYSLIKTSFPFIDFCVWRPSCLTPFMQHVPNVDIILVDVDRDSMEAVFLKLQATIENRPVLLNPSRKELELYMNAMNAVVIRPLVQESPLIEVDGCCVPRIEKVLVDATGDAIFDYAGGSELYSIFQNVFSSYDVNKAKMLRYADRRNRKDAIKKILTTIKPQTEND